MFARRFRRLRRQLRRLLRERMEDNNGQQPEENANDDPELEEMAIDLLDDEGNEYEDDTDHEDEQMPQEVERITADRITYDLNLPGTHQYLGNDLTECISPDLVLQSNLTELIVVRIPGVILLPHQKLPMTNVSRVCQEALLMAKSRGERIGIMAEITITRPDGTSGDTLPSVSLQDCLGVTAEIVAIREGVRENFRAVLKGRERFRVVNFRILEMITRAQVEILHEASDTIGMFPFDQLIPNVYLNRLPRLDRNPREEETMDCCAYSAATLSSWPPHLFQEMDARHLRKRIMVHLYAANDSWRLVETVHSEDHVAFSYWLIHNLLLPDDEVRQLLAMDHVVSRLRGALDILNKPLTYRCTRCQSEIMQHEHLICLAKEGALQTFVNPHGHYFDMITTQVTRHTHFNGGFHIEDSWFPGYSWKIMSCAVCYSHVGWMFKATEDRTLVPQFFYGVVRGSVSAQVQQPETERNNSRTDTTSVNLFRTARAWLRV